VFYPAVGRGSPRVAILQRYLKEVVSEAETVSITGGAGGATGADIRDLVTEAVLASDSMVVSISLLRGPAGKCFPDTTHATYL